MGRRVSGITATGAAAEALFKAMTAPKVEPSPFKFRLGQRVSFKIDGKDTQGRVIRRMDRLKLNPQEPEYMVVPDDPEIGTQHYDESRLEAL